MEEDCGIPTEDLVELAGAPAKMKSDNQEVEERSVSELIELDKYLRAKCAVETTGPPDPFRGLRFGLVDPPSTRGRQ